VSLVARPVTAADIPFAVRPRPALVESPMPEPPAWLDADGPPAIESPVKCPDSWRLLDDVEVMEMADPDYLIEGIIPRRGVGAIYGPSGAGKTTLVADLSVSIATGATWHGRPVLHRGCVVYVATEDPSGYKVRLRAKKVAAGLPLDVPIGVYVFPEPISLRDAVSVRKFTEFLLQVEWPQPLEAIVLDTYAASMPGANENTSEETTMAMAHSQLWRDRLGCAVILVHHSNASGTRERGHSAMRGAADFMISLTPADDVVRVECSKQRNGAPFEALTLKLSPVSGCSGVVFQEAATMPVSATLTPIQAKVLDALREHFTEDGATKGEWQRTCSDVSDRSFHRAAKVLEERGRVLHSGPRFRVAQ